MIGESQDFGLDPRLEPARVLEVLKRLSVERLGKFPTALYLAAEHDLSEAGPDSYPELAGLAVLRARNATDTMNYRQQVAQGFEEFRNPFIRSGAAMGLIEENVIDLHLAGQRLAEILEQRYAEPLKALRVQFEELAVGMRVPAGPNPVSPSRLCATLVSALAGGGVSEGLGRLLFRQYQQQLVPLLDVLYPNLGAILNRAGYGVNAWTPAAIAGFSAAQEARETAEPAAEKPAAPAQTPARRMSDTHGALHHARELEPLREQLRLWRQERRSEGVRALSQPSLAPGAYSGGYGGSGVPLEASGGFSAGFRSGGMVGSSGMSGSGGMGAGPVREFDSREVASIASVLQSEPPDVFARALATSGRLSEVIRSHLADGARRLGMHPENTALSADDEDAVDMVALLFESLFRTHALQDRSRRVYARLVLPYLKIAMHDDAMFVERSHPARKLLDALTEACEDNTGATPQDRELLERASAVSQRIVAEFNEDLSVFEMANAEMEELLGQQRRRVELQEQRAAKASFGRERLSQARAQADGVLQRRIASAPLTQAIGDFLTTPWRHHLVQTLLRDGPDSPRYNEAVSTGDALLHADALAAIADGRSLVRQLLSLEAPLTDCLASSGLDATAASHGLAGIVRGLSDPDAPRRIRAMPAAVRDEPEQQNRLWLAGGTDTLAHDPRLAAEIRELEVGAWLRLSDAQGDPVSAKVAWISPLTSRLLLVNRRGVRVLAASVEELAVLAAEGRLVIDTGRSPFDTAMQQLQEQLRSAVA